MSSWRGLSLTKAHISFEWSLYSYRKNALAPRQRRLIWRSTQFYGMLDVAEYGSGMHGFADAGYSLRIAMNAVIVESFAKAPRYGSFADPAAEAGEVLIQVEAAGLHQIVKSLANGSHYGSTGVLPFIPGVDGVGRLEDGTRVYFGVSRPPFGTFAERAVTKAALSMRL